VAWYKLSPSGSAELMGRTIVALCVHGDPLLTTEFHAPLAIRDMLINVQSSDFVCEDKSESG
jgi:hypothetical protein